MQFLISNSGVITAIVAGKSYVIDKTHVNYSQCLEAVRNNDEKSFVKVNNVSSAIENYMDDNVKIVKNKIYHKGKEINNKVCDRILSQMKMGLPSKNLVNFLGRLLLNPSMKSKNELFGFIEDRKMPICEDGCFVGFKSVERRVDDNNNVTYWDWYSGLIENTPETLIERIPRNEVDDDLEKDCSFGYHVGNYKYASTFHDKDKNQRILVVKVDPADVVAAPPASEKLRTTFYEILRIHEGLMPDLYVDNKANISSSIADGRTNSSPLDESSSPFDDDDYDDYDDYEDEDEDV